MIAQIFSYPLRKRIPEDASVGGNVMNRMQYTFLNFTAYACVLSDIFFLQEDVTCNLSNAMEIFSKILPDFLAFSVKSCRISLINKFDSQFDVLVVSCFGVKVSNIWNFMRLTSLHQIKKRGSETGCGFSR